MKINNKSVEQLALVFLMLIGSPLYGKVVKSSDVKIAEKQIRSLNIKISEVDMQYKDLEWQNSCLDGETNETLPFQLFFYATTKKTFKFKDYDFEEGARLAFCDGKLIYFLSKKNENNRFGIYECASAVYITKKGNLCECSLAKDHIIDGIKISKNSEIVLEKGKLKYILSHGPEKGKTDLVTGAYEVKDGKPVKLYGEITRCNYEE